MAVFARLIRTKRVEYFAIDLRPTFMKPNPIALVPTIVLIVAVLIEQQPVSPPQGWPLHPPAIDATKIKALGKLRAIYPAGSIIEDNEALGGFGPSSNYPFNSPKSEWGAAGSLSIIAFPDESVAYFQNQGFALRVINKTKNTIAFPACDSSLFLTCEAKTKEGT